MRTMAERPAEIDGPMIVLATGGDASAPVRLPSALPPGSIVVAADSGLDRLVAAGIEPHHLVGDLDSAHPELVARARADGTVVHEHPADKDATDLELAVEVAVELASASPERRSLLVVGAGGGRLDHLLADVAVLASVRTEDLEVTAHLGAATLTVVRPGRPRALHGRIGDQVSLLPVHGAASGVTTSGLRWALVDADLVAGTTRAISNELVVPDALVAIGEGVVVAVQPGTRAGRVDARTTPYDPTPRAPGGTP
jgi:thiamine pyrophosphokinase